ncbi:MAG: DUF971 domain-containing protein [Gammaproteobacteria bacterium]|nr:DUF971 domain-containing protein [Gammaproteobacteria bacterium]
MTNRAPKPTDIKLRQKQRILELTFDDGGHYELPCEYLRVYSPSAEVRGHGPGQEVLQIGKEGVNIVAIEPVGTYAIVLRFDDGHDTGIYSWDTLYELAKHRSEYWEKYLGRLEAAGHQRSTQDYDAMMSSVD